MILPPIIILEEVFIGFAELSKMYSIQLYLVNLKGLCKKSDEKTYE